MAAARIARRRALVAGLTALALGVASARADEVRLRDGRVLVGRVEVAADGTHTIHTWDGPVLVQADDVVRLRTDSDLRKEFQRVRRASAETPFSEIQLARTALGYGLERELWRHLDRAVESIGSPFGDTTAAPSPLARPLQDLLRDLEPVLVPPHLRQTCPEARAEHLLRSLRSDAGPGKRAGLLTQLVALDAIDDALLSHSREGRLEHQRHFALEALAFRSHPDNTKALLRTSVLGHKQGDRAAAAELVKRTGAGAEGALYIASGLFHDSPDVRVQTAAALAAFGDRDIAVPLLVFAGPLAGTPARKKASGGDIGTRGYMMALNIKSYIRDFEVEIAQGSAVANPVVDSLRSGVVLDAKVAAVISQRARIALSYRRSLHDLTGSDPGANPAEWLDWLREQDPAAASRAATGKIADRADSPGAEAQPVK